jgi:hypothetical protein
VEVGHIVGQEISEGKCDITSLDDASPTEFDTVNFYLLGLLSVLTL